jgi:hypothetical protein
VGCRGNWVGCVLSTTARGARSDGGGKGTPTAEEGRGSSGDPPNEDPGEEERLESCRRDGTVGMKVAGEPRAHEGIGVAQPEPLSEDACRTGIEAGKSAGDASSKGIGRERGRGGGESRPSKVSVAYVSKVELKSGGGGARPLPHPGERSRSGHCAEKPTAAASSDRLATCARCGAAAPQRRWACA